MNQDFACTIDAEKVAKKLSRRWKYHTLESIEVQAHSRYGKAGRPTKNQSPLIAMITGLMGKA